MAKVIEKRPDGTVVLVVSPADAEVGAAVDVLPKYAANGQDQPGRLGRLP